MLKGGILVVDDHISVLEALEQILEPHFNKVVTISSTNRIHEFVRGGEIDVVLLDMNFTEGPNTGSEGLYWIKTILEYDPEMVIVPITAYSDVNIAVEAMKLGAVDFVLKPWNNEALIATLKTVLKLRFSSLKIKELKETGRYLEKKIDKFFDPLIGESKTFMKVLDTLKKIAPTDANILITGESGTGKELFAREIHRLSDRHESVMISIDVGALPDTLFESELFGHVKGAFTDANSDRPGRLVMANNGTLFIDEIGNLPTSLQKKILTVLQNQEVTPLGSNFATKIDFRVICATNKLLEDMIRDGTFREDLYYRINTIELKLPPLRERKDDIEILTNHFISVFGKKYLKTSLKISGNVIDKLLNYSWPGNIRELKHTIEKAVILNDSGVLTGSDFQFINDEKPKGTGTLKTLAEIESEAIKNALARNNGNVRYAAIELDITRQTLYNKIKLYNL